MADKTNLVRLLFIFPMTLRDETKGGRGGVGFFIFHPKHTPPQ